MEQKIDELVKSYRNDMIQSLEELVKIPSVINLESAGEGAPFGQEIRSALDALMELAKILAEEPEAFQDALRRNLKDGMTFPKARSMALSAVFPESEKYQQLLFSPNNIL